MLGLLSVMLVSYCSSVQSVIYLVTAMRQLRRKKYSVCQLQQLSKSAHLRKDVAYSGCRATAMLQG